MTPVAIVATGAVSALGVGDGAFDPGALGEPARVAVGHDARLASLGLARPISARVGADVGEGRDAATRWLVHALRGCAEQLDEVRPGWRRERVGLVVGTSAGGMETATAWFDAGAPTAVLDAETARRATYFGPLADAALSVGVAWAEVAQILGACAASVIALGVATRWIALDRCDLVLAGGYDALGAFVARGFEVLGATSASPPRPFRLGRDGLALGEGAAIAALARPSVGGSRARVYVAGFGASTDAHHITAPDPSGAQLARAATRALADAGVAPPDVGLVGAHATATPFNDAAEARALERVMGGHRPIVHPMKAQIGHALGAAGALETLALGAALARGLAPAAAGEGPRDPACDVELLDRTARSDARIGLKWASAFGGANAALVLRLDAVGAAAPAAGRAVAAHGRVVIASAPDLEQLARTTGRPLAALARTDGVGRLALAAVGALRDRLGAARLAGAGIVVGHSLATLDGNAAFWAGGRARGARGFEPRRFPATSPNAAGGECAIAYGLTGPSFGVGASLAGGLEALAVACDLVAAGDAERMVVVAADEVGEASRALLGFAGWPSLASGAVATLVEVAGAGEALARPALHAGAPLAVGHLALEAWLARAGVA